MQNRFARRALIASVAAFLISLMTPSRAGAQVTVTLPDTGQTTTLSAIVTEQARVTFPAAVSFAVAEVTSATSANAASVTISNIVLATATKQVKISLQADSANFTPPVAGAASWSAGDVSWAAGSWTNATGASGTLSASAYNAVATCAADAPACSTTGLVLTLGAKPAVQRSGTHTLIVRWKVEAIGS